MLRNHCGCAWRRLVAFLLFFSFFFAPAARGAVIVGLPPGPPANPPSSSTQTSFSLSGYLTNDATSQGFPYIAITLLQMTPTGGTQDFVTPTTSTGYYVFTGLTAGDTYTISEPAIQYFTPANSVGSFVTTSGATVSPLPTGASVGSLSGSYSIADIVFQPSSAGSYYGVNYNFGQNPEQFPVVGVPPTPFIPAPPGTGGGGGGGGGTPTASATYSTALAAPADDRLLIGTGSLNLTATVANTGAAGTTPLTWSISTQSAGVSLNPTSATLSPGAQSNPSGTVNGASLTMTGTQDVSVTFSGQLGSGTASSSTATAVIDPVQNRQATASQVNLGRILAGATATSGLTITSTGAYVNYSNLTLNPVSATASTTGNSAASSISLSNTATVPYNGTITSNNGATNFLATFSNTASGPTSGTASFVANSGLFSPETFANLSTSSVQNNLSVSYSATVLQPNTAFTSTTGTATAIPFNAPTLGGFLSGATLSSSAGYTVTTLGDSSHYTNIYVSATNSTSYFSYDGKTAYSNSAYPFGMVSATQTLVTGTTPTAVPVSVTINGAGPHYAVANLNVSSAEAASVQDNTNYQPITFAYHVNNAYFAATGGAGTGPGTVGGQAYGAPLSAQVAAGSRLATYIPSGGTGDAGVPLSSQVAATGSNGASSVATYFDGSTLANNSNANSTYPYGHSASISSTAAQGVVGTQGSIYDSTAITTSAISQPVQMSWRARNSVENGSLTPSAAETLPAGVKWFTSDVLDLEGVPNGTAFALDMTYDDAINLALEHPTQSGVVASQYIAMASTNSSGVTSWQNAALAVTPGSLASQYQGVGESLTQFLDMAYSKYEAAPYSMTHDQILQALVGSWGVDIPAAGQIGDSWTIVNTNGQFAVVPEPTTFALLGAGLAGLVVYRTWRKRRNAPAARLLRPSQMA